MAGQKHIGYVIFTICAALSARLAFFEPDPQPPVLTAAEERWGPAPKQQDTFGFIHGLRFYIYGIGIVGLLIVAEDHFAEQSRKKKAAANPPAKPPAAGPRDP